MSKPNTTNTSLTIERRFDADPERVYQALTDPDQLAQWFAPSPLTPEIRRISPEVGAPFEVAMIAEDATHTSSGEIVEIQEAKRLAMTWRWHEGPSDEHSVLTFELEPTPEGGTLLTLRHEKLPDRDTVEDHLGGWESCLDRLQDALA